MVALIWRQYFVRCTVARRDFVDQAALCGTLPCVVIFRSRRAVRFDYFLRKQIFNTVSLLFAGV